MFRRFASLVAISISAAGCATVKMPEVTPSHPASPEAASGAIPALPQVLEIPENPVVAPPLPVPTGGSSEDTGEMPHAMHEHEKLSAVGGQSEVVVLGSGRLANRIRGLVPLEKAT